MFRLSEQQDLGACAPRSCCFLHFQGLVVGIHLFVIDNVFNFMNQIMNVAEASLVFHYSVDGDAYTAVSQSV